MLNESLTTMFHRNNVQLSGNVAKRLLIYLFPILLLTASDSIAQLKFLDRLVRQLPRIIGIGSGGEGANVPQHFQI